MSTGAVPGVTPSQQPPLSQVARVINTFIAPTTTFTDLKRSASWWAPFALIAMFGILFTYAVQQQVGFDKVAYNQVKASPSAADRLERMAPEQRAQQLEISAKASMYVSYGFPLLLLFFWAVLAGIFLATYNFALGAELRYATAFAVIAYAALPHVLKSVLATIALYAGMDPDGFMIQNPVATNLGHLVDPANSAVVYGLLSAVDIIQIWTLLLSAIGFSCVTKVKRSTSIAVVFGWYVVLTLVFTAIGALFS